MRRLAGFWGRGLGFCRLGGVGGAGVVLGGWECVFKDVTQVGRCCLGYGAGVRRCCVCDED